MRSRGTATASGFPLRICCSAMLRSTGRARPPSARRAPLRTSLGPSASRGSPGPPPRGRGFSKGRCARSFRAMCCCRCSRWPSSRTAPSPTWRRSARSATTRPSFSPSTTRTSASTFGEGGSPARGSPSRRWPPRSLRGSGRSRSALRSRAATRSRLARPTRSRPAGGSGAHAARCGRSPRARPARHGSPTAEESCLGRAASWRRARRTGRSAARRSVAAPGSRRTRRAAAPFWATVARRAPLPAAWRATPLPIRASAPSRRSCSPHAPTE